MLHTARYIALVAGLLVTLAAPAADDGWQHPAIQGYGGMKPLPEAANQPDPETTHKAVFELRTTQDDPGRLNAGLERVARAVNVFAAAGVPADRREFVVVVHGPATRDVLDDTHYRREYGTANPNTALIAALRQAGVSMHVCGQALAKHAFESNWVDDHVSVVLSALSDLVIYGERGYALVEL